MIGNRIRTAYHCEVELLTPLHIGSGERYVENFDFFYESSRHHLFVFDRNRLLQQVAEAGEETITSFFQAVEDESLDKWLKSKPEGIHLGQTLLHRFSCDRKPRDILVQLRTGTGEPLLAGSSLKGALRTAVLARLSSEEGRQSVHHAVRNLLNQKQLNLKFADSRICKNLLGLDAQKNLMRSLAVSDFSFARDAVKLQRVVVTRQTGRTSMQVKFPVVLENIPKNSRAGGQISFDEFLGEYGRKTMGFRTLLSLPWLVEAIRMKTEKTIATELDFLKDIRGEYVSDLKGFYRQLQERVRSLNKDEVILQLAWGSGWKGMTGELLNQEELTPQLRDTLKLAQQYSNYPFPKSRRVAITDDGAMPLGWVKLTFTDKEEIRRREEAKIRKDQQDEAERQEREQARARKKEEWERMSKVEQYVAIILGSDNARSQVPEKDALRDVWPKLDSLEAREQKEVARAFYASWSSQEKL